jgi:sugar lactone lactonase YvrE
MRIRSNWIVAAALLLSPLARAQVVGSLAGGYTGDDGPALSGAFGSPQYIAVDASGNVYVADEAYHRVRRVSADGFITTFAGMEESGYSGDGGPATLAHLNGPVGVALDPSGGLLIADSGNGVIRRVDLASGIIQTIAGGAPQPLPGLGDEGPATSAWLWYPEGISVTPAGEILITDTGSPLVRKIDAQGNIHTVAGVYGHRGFNEWAPPPNPAPFGFVPQELALPATQSWLGLPRQTIADAAGDLFIADYSNQRVREVSAATGLMTTAAGTTAQRVFGYRSPSPTATPVFYGAIAPVVRPGLPVDVENAPDGSIHFNANIGIWRLGTPSSPTPLIRSSGWGSDGDGVGRHLLFPIGIQPLAGGDELIADTGNVRLRRVTPAPGLPFAATFTTIAGGNTGDGTFGAFNVAQDVAADTDGSVYVADWNNHRIRRIDPDGTVSTVVGTGMSEFAAARLPFRTVLGPGPSVKLFRPTSVAVDHLHNLYIADSITGRVLSLDASSGNVVQLATLPTNPIALALDDAGGILYVSEGSDLFALDLAAGTLAQLATPALSFVWHMTMGPDKSLYLSDGNAGVIYRRTPDGAYAVIAGRESFCTPRGIAVDSSGEIFVSDLCGFITQIAPDGTVAVDTVGAYPSGFADDQPAASARFDHPDGIALDARGNLIVADGAHVRIVARNAADALGVLVRRVQRRDPPALLTQLEAAGESIARGNQDAARGQLGAFTKFVSAQSGKAVAADEASRLIADAAAVVDLLAPRGRPVGNVPPPSLHVRPPDDDDLAAPDDDP